MVYKLLMVSSSKIAVATNKKELLGLGRCRLAWKVSSHDHVSVEEVPLLLSENHSRACFAKFHVPISQKVQNARNSGWHQSTRR